MLIKKIILMNFKEKIYFTVRDTHEKNASLTVF
jgi:hypothetical protein